VPLFGEKEAIDNKNVYTLSHIDYNKRYLWVVVRWDVLFVLCVLLKDNLGLS